MEMTTFDDREKQFEAKFAHDAELKFKIIARRNKLLGLWAAEKLGISGGDAEAYAKDVVASDFEKPGDEDVLEKVLGDLQGKVDGIDAHEIRRQMTALLDDAQTQVMAEVKDA